MKCRANAICDWFEQMGLPKPDAEYRFHPSRRWRFDYAWPQKRIALEVEGGIWIQGRHVRGYGYEKDIEKYNQAQLLGWIVLRTVPRKLMTSATINLIKRAIAENNLRSKKNENQSL